MVRQLPPTCLRESAAMSYANLTTVEKAELRSDTSLSTRVTQLKLRFRPDPVEAQHEMVTTRYGWHVNHLLRTLDDPPTADAGAWSRPDSQLLTQAVPADVLLGVQDPITSRAGRCPDEESHAASTSFVISTRSSFVKRSAAGLCASSRS